MILQALDTNPTVPTPEIAVKCYKVCDRNTNKINKFHPTFAITIIYLGHAYSPEKRSQN